MIYWDTSCVIKLYAAEPDSDHWQERLAQETGPCLSSSLLQAELAYALLQKELRGAVRSGSAKRLLEHVERHVKQGRFELLPVGADVLEQAVALARLCYAAKPAVALRTADGIHLATALVSGCSLVATTDQRMMAALPMLNLKLLTP